MVSDLIILFACHYLADFLFQSREMGKKKSEDLKVLAEHGTIIFAVFFLFGTLFLDKSMVLFSLIYAVIHCLQDGLIWRGYKALVKYHIKYAYHDYWAVEDESVEKGFKDWKYWEDKRFYDTIGLDQTLHAITILLVYNWVM